MSAAANAAALGSVTAAKNPRDFVRANTALIAPPLVPELKLHLASEAIALWQATEAELEASGLPPPYWAFAWAGGQALSRYLLDTPGLVAGKRVLDFAAGSALQGLAARKAGAAQVTASEVDDFAAAAVRLNAEANGLALELARDDLLGHAPEPERYDVVLAGDVCYERPMAERAFAWLQAYATAGTLVLLGDPGRAYLPKAGLEELARYQVPVSRDLEDREIRDTRVYRVVGQRAP
ncbi:MAG: class I SAM-dependent methyltransferase [Kiloniellales bacterium]